MTIIITVIAASGNEVPAYLATLYASHITKAGGVCKFFSAPGSGGTES